MPSGQHTGTSCRKERILTELPNVILTPHLGWPTDEAYVNLAAAVADALLDYLDGKDVPRFLSNRCREGE